MSRHEWPVDMHKTMSKSEFYRWARLAEAAYKNGDAAVISFMIFSLGTERCDNLVVFRFHGDKNDKILHSVIWKHRKLGYIL